MADCNRQSVMDHKVVIFEAQDMIKFWPFEEMLKKKFVDDRNSLAV